MFEDFSFSSPSSQPHDRLMVDCDSTLISPLSSQCPSPQPQRFPNLTRSHSTYFRTHQQQQPPTSVPIAYEHKQKQKRLSISTVTEKLREHSLQTPTTSLEDRYTNSVLTPPDTDHDEEYYGDSSTSVSSVPSPTTITTTMPSEYISLDSRMDHHLTVRKQRQHISRLQCNPAEMEIMRPSVLDVSSDSRDSDDCHPSSLPSRSSPRRRAVTLHRSRFGPDSIVAERGRRRSSSGVLQSHHHRVDKNKGHHYSSSGLAAKQSELGLRRKSLVSAALASMVENTSP